METLALLQDPRNKGGTATAVSWYRRWMQENRPSYHEYFLDDVGPTGIRSLRQWNKSSSAIPRVLPRLHVPQYFAARSRLRRALDTPDEVHVVGASVVHGSLGPSGPPMLVWFATLIGDERRSVIAHKSLSRRLLYSATLTPLVRIERSVLARANRILVMSPYSADLIVRSGVAPASRIEVLPVPINTDVFLPPIRERQREGLLFVGRAHDVRKGFDRLVRLADVSQALQGRRIDVVSPGRPLALGDRFRWHGRVDNLADVYSRAELLVLPSLQEGFGIVAFEALACGTPVVAYRCGGPDKQLTESGGGVIVDDDASFHSTVEALLSDEDARYEMGERGRRYVQKHMSAYTFLHDTTVFSVAP